MQMLFRRQACWLIPAAATVLAGCWGEPTSPVSKPTSFTGISLKVGAIDDRSVLSGVTLLRGEWEASRGGAITVVDEPVSVESASTVDVVIFPGQRLGDLVDADALAVIPNSAVMPPKPVESVAGERSPADADAAKERASDAFQYMDFVPAFRDEVSRYGEDRLGLPAGGSALVLVYRRDAFENESNRAAASKAGLELEPPKTWDQLDALAKFLEARDWNGDGKPDHGMVLAMGADPEGVGDTAFLARAASLGQHRDHFSFLFESDALTPRIDSPPFVEALKGMVAWKGFGPAGVERFDAKAAREAFRTGGVAMLIDRAEQAATWSHGKPLGVAALPGSDRVYEPAQKQWKPASPLNKPSYVPKGGGWLIGISTKAEGTQSEAALDFAKYLVSPDNLNRLRTERSFPMLAVRASQIGQGLPDPTLAPDVDSRQWTLAVGNTLQLDRVVPGLRIHDAGGYLADLAKGRLAAAGGEPPEKALQAVAKAWNERTAGLGPLRQLWHYRRSLNKLTTTRQRPERGK
jgi:multiple sugar transport system substrate-binding protein